MKEDGDCGYSCSEEKQNLQGIIDRTLDFAKKNPQWGMIMLGKFQEMIYESTMKLPTPFTVVWSTENTNKLDKPTINE